MAIQRILILTAALGVVVAVLPAQRRGFQRFEDDYQSGSSRSESLYSLKRSQERTYNWEQAQDLLATGKAREAVETLHKLLLDPGTGVIEIGDQRYLGVRQAALQVLRDLPPRATEAYQKLAEREGGQLMVDDLDAMTASDLERLANTFPTLPRGWQARLRLGRLALETGDALTAATHFQQAADSVPLASDGDRAAVRLWQAVAAALVQPAVARNHGLARDFNDGTEGPARDVIDDALIARPPSVCPTHWPAFGSGHDGSARMLRPAGRPEVQPPIQGIRTPDGENLTMHAVGGLEGVFVNDGRQVWAIDPLRAEVMWRAEGPAAVVRTRYGRRGDASNPGMVYAAAVSDDVVVAALEVPTNEEELMFRGGIRIMARLPDRRLYAFERSTGRRLWAHWDRIDDGALNLRYRSHIASAPPVIHGDTIYCANHDRSGTIALYLSAYDLHTGAPKWRRLLCSSQQEVNMFGNAQQEYASGPLSLSDGILYGTSNLGICYAVDARTGDIRWISGYDVISLPRTRLHGQRSRPVYFANNPPVITDGVVAFTPLDSEFALGLDAHTGQPLWEMHHTAQAGSDHDVRWMLGAIGDEIVFSGTGVVAVKARPGPTGTDRTAPPTPVSQPRDGARPAMTPRVRSIKSPDAIGHSRRPRLSSLARGAITDELIYYCGGARLMAFDMEGNIDYRSTDLSFEDPGNLLLVDGVAVSVRSGQLHVAYDALELRRRALALLKDDPTDVVAQFRLANLLRVVAQAGGGGSSSAASEQAVDAFQRALRLAADQGMGPGVPLWDQISQELFDLTMDRGASLIVVDRAGAAKQFELARERAPDPSSWMAAHIELLTCIAEEQQIPELQRMARSHGALRFGFDEGELPVAAYALWREANLRQQPGSKVADPAAAVIGFQDLLERYPDETFAERSGRDIATETIARLLEAHGKSLYAPIEERAQAALKDADSPEALQVVVTTWPHSAAAGRAIGGILDGAVAAGDLATVCRVFADRADTDPLTPSLLRRLMITATRGGNQPLARALGEGLAARHGKQASDVPEDEGATYGSLALPAISATPVPPLDRPAALLGQFELPPQQPRMATVEQVAGFTAPADTPVYATVAGETLLAFDPGDIADTGATAAGTPLFRQTVDMVFGPLFQAGQLLVVPGLSSVRAYHYRTGAPVWEYVSPKAGLQLDCVGGHSGVLHLFANSSNRPSELVGVEATTGVALFRREFPARATPGPRPTALDLVLLHTELGVSEFRRIHPVTGETQQSVPLTAAVKTLHGWDDNNLDRRFCRALFASEDTIYLPSFRDGTPQLVALDPKGNTRFVWVGTRGSVLEVHALRGSTLVLVEVQPVDGVGRLLTLDAATGEVRLDRPLGDDIAPLNWTQGWTHNPAPRNLLLTDRLERGPLRLTCLKVEADDPTAAPSFQLELPADIQDVKDQPLLDGNLLVFAAHGNDPSARLKLFALDPSTRRSVFSDKPFKVLENERYSDVRRAGRYTVVGARTLQVLGNK